MNPIDFQRHFKSSIRVQLNWDRFVRSDWTVELLYFSLPRAAPLLFSPWYASQHGQPCGFSDDDAVPQSLYDVAQNTQLLQHHKVCIQGKPADDRILAVPAYRLPQGAVLLLDGNHRCASAVISGSELGLVAVVVNGPIDSKVLPDLAHWV